MTKVVPDGRSCCCTGSWAARGRGVGRCRGSGSTATCTRSTPPGTAARRPRTSHRRVRRRPGGRTSPTIDEPIIVIGHSMGALHAWCFAAAHPGLVAALVLEDMAPDFRGRTADELGGDGVAWPQPFPTEDDCTRILRSGRRTLLPRLVRASRRRLVPARRRLDVPRHLRGVGPPALLGRSGRPRPSPLC